ncbi:unnamed protein product [Rhizophagus irregularis]|nr:unnamed protein product [Rhizophagus irregularis]
MVSLSVFVFGKSENGSFGIRLQKVGKWASGVLILGNEEPKGLFGVLNEMDLRCLSLRNEETKGNAGRLDDEFETNGSRRLDDSGRLDDEFRNEPVPDVRMMETTGSGRLDNGNQNEPVSSGRLDNEFRNEPVKGEDEKRKGKEKTKEKMKGKGSAAHWTYGIQHFEGLTVLGRMEFNISKV